MGAPKRQKKSLQILPIFPRRKDLVEIDELKPGLPHS